MGDDEFLGAVNGAPAAALTCRVNHHGNARSRRPPKRVFGTDPKRSVPIRIGVPS